MRKLLTAAEAKVRVTLSFSAHSTGSLRFPTSTATGSASAPTATRAWAKSTAAAAPAARKRAAHPLPRCGRRSALAHTIDIPGIGLVRQLSDVGGHFGPGQPALERQPLAFAEGKIEPPAAERA